MATSCPPRTSWHHMRVLFWVLSLDEGGTFHLAPTAGVSTRGHVRGQRPKPSAQQPALRPPWLLLVVFSLISPLVPSIGKHERKRERASRDDPEFSPSAATQLYGQTRGRGGVDLATSESVTFDSTAIKAVATNVSGALGHGMSALRHSSTTLQGLFVLPGVIDADYQGEIKIMMWTPTQPCYLPSGPHVG